MRRWFDDARWERRCVCFFTRVSFSRRPPTWNFVAKHIVCFFQTRNFVAHFPTTRVNFNLFWQSLGKCFFHSQFFQSFWWSQLTRSAEESFRGFFTPKHRQQTQEQQQKSSSNHARRATIGRVLRRTRERARREAIERDRSSSGGEHREEQFRTRWVGQG